MRRLGRSQKKTQSRCRHAATAGCKRVRSNASSSLAIRPNPGRCVSCAPHQPVQFSRTSLSSTRLVRRRKKGRRMWACGRIPNDRRSRRVSNSVLFIHRMLGSRGGAEIGNRGVPRESWVSGKSKGNVAREHDVSACRVCQIRKVSCVDHRSSRSTTLAPSLTPSLQCRITCMSNNSIV